MIFGAHTKMVDPDRALPGRDEPMPVPDRHFVLGTPLQPPFPEGLVCAPKIISTSVLGGPPTLRR